VPKQGLKFHVTTLVCQVTGGPCAYVGRDMKASHAHLRITEEEWQAMAADFRKTLDHFSVPAAEQAELFAIVESTKPDIVVGARAAAN
jgi:hemoglobin